MQNSKTMILAEKLTRDYGPIRAVDQVSFEISRGEIIGFLGPNGAGKTTTMKLITGYIQPTLGRVKVDGDNVEIHSLTTKQKIGYLPENAPLYDDMMVAEFIDFTAQVRNIPQDEVIKRKKEVIDRCGIGNVLHKDIGTLSKGYRQRVGLAQAIIHDPQVLILDEPTSGLDPNQIVEIRELIKELGQEKTVILSTHILPEVQATCTRVMIMNNGRVVADDTPQALSASQGSNAIKVEFVKADGSDLDPQQIQEKLKSIAGIISTDQYTADDTHAIGISIKTNDIDIRKEVFQAAVANDLIMLHLSQEQVSLEETFRKLTVSE